MGFLKNMINGRQSTDDHVNIEDVAALVDEAQAENSSQAEAFSKLTGIQSRIKDTQSDPEYIEVDAAVKQESSGQIMDFADLLHNMKESAPSEPDQGTVLSPVMTEDDFAKLDDELARMSDELEEQATTRNETDAEISESPDARAAATSGAVAEARSAIIETSNAESEIPPRQPGTILVSELQGGAAMPATVSAERNAAPAKPAPGTERDGVLAPHRVEVPAPAQGRSGRRAGRVKTRLLGFEHSNDRNSDPFSEGNNSVAANQVDFPVGWIIVVDGPGFGTAFALFNGVSQIGRGMDQTIKLDFGDTSISRENHAAIAYDAEQSKFFLGHGGKANLVRLNDNPVLSTEEINNKDIIRIGETTLRFAALCGADFNWDSESKEDENDAAIA